MTGLNLQVTFSFTTTLFFVYQRRNMIVFLNIVCEPIVMMGYQIIFIISRLLFKRPSEVECLLMLRCMEPWLFEQCRQGRTPGQRPYSHCNYCPLPIYMFSEAELQCKFIISTMLFLKYLIGPDVNSPGRGGTHILRQGGMCRSNGSLFYKKS